MMKFRKSVLLLILFSLIQSVYAGERFKSSYPCVDGGKYCASSGTRVVDDIRVHRDCWEWAYNKSCNYPSKNNCGQYAHCYDLGDRDCLLRDSLGNCVNIKREYSCKRWVPTYVESFHGRIGAKEIEGKQTLICKGIPCMDGNCVDKSYDMDADMVSSVAQFSALSKIKTVDANFKLFEGKVRHCTKKAAGFSSCCKIVHEGWGEHLGAHCNAEEKILNEFRIKKLCAYAGRVHKQKMNIKVASQHYYCCFNNILEKVIQEQGRAQLYPERVHNKTLFGTGEMPDCRGLTLEEIKRIDFSKLNYSEVAADIMKKLVLPNIADIEGRVRGSLDNNMKKFDESKPAHIDNKIAGTNTKTMRKYDD